MGKYYIDTRAGCIGVRAVGTDSEHLEENSEGVVAYYPGYLRDDGCWVVPQFKHEQARTLLKLINKEST